ncbi:hypothetical protein TBLA_0A00700 [Henningerozyma blattae CBS 6284]|uniref:Protein farnesyltransferase/geranylgeranyltransferase type-1 subunit alpha n=1 Tax=Henningerozyma blattae (strain ATCC 34711 / CBS 6284 / DSM 70876 / NBRC 10599 / NRRL Y-10934 / UCD 77-7) TaxID=1071380 RepID=I2GUR9_HENB6|nr:hypothetical protein TBLA_0A00700 [Tetrapisispora blattae CBS 6284]CCH57871.1 hypothetical protein TBLA_0A00700 [Tetrapisispora blattae CBS 6284]
MTEEFLLKFQDIKPTPIQTDIPNELCQILYTKEYANLMGVTRTLMNNREHSKRALELTSVVIEIAPAFYTVWNYRYNIIHDMVLQLKDANQEKVIEFLNKDLDWLDELTLNNPKNYQIWSYRQAILNLHPKPDFKRDLPILKIMLHDDTKNYHVWSYRKWLIDFVKNDSLFDFNIELNFTNIFIDRDIYNNSAWTHRLFVIKTNPANKNIDFNSKLIQNEIIFTKKNIHLCPQNISSWNYLIALLDWLNNGKATDDLIEFASQFVSDFFSNTAILPNIQSSYALEFLADQYKLDPKRINDSIKAYKALSTKYDPIRTPYWNHLIKGLS